MHGSKAESGDNAEDIPHRLTAKVAGPAIAAGAISLGLVLIGACGLGQHDVYVAPPPLSADGHVATGTRAASSTSPTYIVVIPPSPSWRIASRTTPRRTSTTSPFPSYPGDTPTTDPFATTTDPFDEQSFDTSTTPPTSSTDPFDEQDTTTPSETTDPQSHHHRSPSEEGDN